MQEPKLTYNQLRQILGLTISNGTLKAKLQDFLSGKLTKVSEVELLELIQNSEVDKDLIRILSGQDPEQMDAVEALEYISSFFVYIRASREKCKDWLGNLGLAVATAKNTDTPTRSSK